MDQNNPALVAARSSWRCVRAKDKQGWLALMSSHPSLDDRIAALKQA